MSYADDTNTPDPPRQPQRFLETPYIPQPLVAPYLDEHGHCLFHPDLLPMDCTLVARLGCLGCIYSTRNLDPIELPDGATPRPPSSDDRPIWEINDA